MPLKTTLKAVSAVINTMHESAGICWNSCEDAMQVIAAAKVPKGMQNKACVNLLKHDKYDCPHAFSLQPTLAASRRTRYPETTWKQP